MGRNEMTAKSPRRGLLCLALATTLCLALAPATANAGFVRVIEGPFGSAEQPTFGNDLGLAVDHETGELLVIDAGRNEVQTVQFTGFAPGDTFTLTCPGGEATAAVSYTESVGPLRTNIRDALEATCGEDNFAVDDGPLEITVEYTGAFALTDVPTTTCAVVSGGGSCSASESTSVVGAALKRFNEDGTPSEFAALGGNVIDAEGGGECPAVPADCDQTPDDGFAFAATGTEVQVAIDESGGANDGNIYVVQGVARPTVEVFASSGEFLGRLTAAGPTPFTQVCGVTVDPAGNVFVGSRAGSVHRFVPAANPPVDADHVASFAYPAEPCGMAAGVGPTAGSLFFVDANPSSFSDGERLYRVVAATGAIKYTFGGVSGCHRAATVDPLSGHVITGWCSWVREFDASGGSGATDVARIPASGQTYGVAATGASERIYFSTGEAVVPNVRVLGPLVAFPEAATAPATNVEETTVTLNGTVDPDGGEVDECLFEYGKTASYGSTIPCAQSGAEIGSGEDPVPVHADLAGLDLGDEYHFRLIASNAVGETKGEDESFKLKSPPVISGAWAEDIGVRVARLKADVNPEGFATTYRIEWGLTDSYGNSTVESGIGSGKESRIATAFLDGLTPGTTYHFRIVATNAIGTSESEDRAFTTFALPTPADPCPNDNLRGGPSSRLPDCRAYEQVSPREKNGGDIITVDPLFPGERFPAFKQGSLDGNKVTYSSTTAFGDAVAAPVSSQYVSSRGGGGWSTHGISPPLGISLVEDEENKLVPITWGPETLFEGFTPDLCSAWVRNDRITPLTPDGLEGFANLYRRSNCGQEGYEALTNEGPFGATTPYLNDSGEFGGAGGAGPGVRFQGASEDLSHQVFVSSARLLVSATAGQNTQLYDLHDGTLELLSVLPNGKADPDYSSAGAMIGGGARDSLVDHAVSEDGSRIFWTSTSDPGAAGPGRIYARLDGEETIPVSEAAEGLSGAGESLFATAAADGSAVIFRTANFDSSYRAANADLYEFDVDTETTRPIAGGSPGVVGASDDLSRIYFASTEDLAAGASAGAYNLYLEEEGTVEHVATLSELDREADEFGGLYGPSSLRGTYRTSRVSPDGRHLAFQAFASLTGYDNVDPQTGKRFAEVYRYDADAGRLSCVSCNPTGARPVGPPVTKPYARSEGPLITFGPALRAATGQAATLPTCERAQQCSRVISDDGNRVYFHSYEPLALGDTNGVKDVYQWEAPGSGSCEVGDGNYVAQNDGCLDLISTGTSPQRSEFYDASADGRDVFFSTSSGIDPRDEGLIDVYDARAGGGYPVPSSPPECVGDACQSPAAAPSDPTPGSAAFRGAGNVTPAPAARRNCRAQARRAAKLSRRAKRLRRAGARAKAPRRGKQLRRRATKLAKRAKKTSRRATRCRRANRGGRR